MAVCLECGFDGKTEGAACPKCAAAPTVKGAPLSPPLPPASSSASDAFLPGATLARKYEIRRRLGVGGFGVVYLAHDIGLDKDVAVKVLQVSDPSTMEGSEAKKRFLREARALARLDTHPNIVRVMSVDEEKGVPYFIMEYVPEGTLLDLLRKGPLPPARAAAICADVSAALAAVHATGIIHRDLKPANIFIKGERAMLGDFGIARVAHESTLTVGSGMPGTPMYMSPESLLGREVDGRSDIFSLGCVLYESITGSVLFKGDALGQVVSRIVDPADVDLKPLRDAFPAPILGVLKRSLAKRVSERYPSARFIERDLRAFAGGASSAPGSSPVKVSADALRAVTLGPGASGIRMPEPRPAKRASDSRSLVLASGALVLAAAALWFVVRSSANRPEVAAPLPPRHAAGPNAAGATPSGRETTAATEPPLEGAATSAEPGTPAKNVDIQVDLDSSVRTEGAPRAPASGAEVSADFRPVRSDDAIAKRVRPGRLGAGEVRPTLMRDDMQAPEVINRVEPEYPEGARQAGEEGMVVVEVVVDRSGEVAAARVVKGNPFFDDAALAAVRQWRFRPAMDGGRPVKMVGTVTVDFRMKPHS
ncbi:MAG: TonB family protein [Acidobacteria bacterium]|nr:TonB family protein [Acidobacteriota bacterium]